LSLLRFLFPHPYDTIIPHITTLVNSKTHEFRVPNLKVLARHERKVFFGTRYGLARVATFPLQVI